MQNSYRLASDAAQVRLAAAQTRFPFPEIKFIRLVAWKECEAPIKSGKKTALAGQVFQSYTLPSMKGVFIDFCRRGAKLQLLSAMALARVLSESHVVAASELFTIEETLCANWINPLDDGNTIDHAQVGDLSGNLTLAIEWTDIRANCKRISLYIASQQDLTVVREIHFSAPVESFHQARKYFSEVLRSVQWQECVLQQAYQEVA
jgi:hypothetical protein